MGIEGTRAWRGQWHVGDMGMEGTRVWRRKR